jgi:hypothetical protein
MVLLMFFESGMIFSFIRMRLNFVHIVSFIFMNNLQKSASKNHRLFKAMKSKDLKGNLLCFQ